MVVPPSLPPTLISIEGIDGSGKSTQAIQVVRHLELLNIRAQRIAVQAFGARAVNMLAEEINGDPHAYHPTIPAELREWVFACDVAYYCKANIRPLLDGGVTVVWDRGPLSYAASADAYDGLSPWVQRAQSLFPTPWRSFLLVIPPDLAAARVQARSGKAPRTDENVEHLRAVQERMLHAASGRSDVVPVDATQSPDTITSLILDHWLSAG